MTPIISQPLELKPGLFIMNAFYGHTFRIVSVTGELVVVEGHDGIRRFGDRGDILEDYVSCTNHNEHIDP